MNNQTSCSAKEIHECLEGLAFCLAHELREEACERGIDIGAFSEWTLTDQGIEAVSLALATMLDRFVVSAIETKP